MSRDRGFSSSPVKRGSSGRFYVAQRSASHIIVIRQSFFTFFEVFPTRATHRVLPYQNDRRIFTQFVFLLLNFQLRLWRWLPADLYEVLDCEQALRLDPFAACAWHSCFYDDLDWHFSTSQQLVLQFDEGSCGGSEAHLSTPSMTLTGELAQSHIRFSITSLPSRLQGFM